VAPRFYDLDEDGVPIRWIEMMRHTLKSLGPKVLSTRMLREYVERLYAPAAVSSRSMNDSFQGASELAAWKSHVIRGWSQVSIDHVETEGLSDVPEIGGGMDLRVFVSLGELAPQDVEVQVVHGRVRGEDNLVDTTTEALALGESYEGGRHRFDGHVRLARAGSFGYTVRVLPQHSALASPAELGLVALA
jgi:starch phosphorylase